MNSVPSPHPAPAPAEPPSPAEPYPGGDGGPERAGLLERIADAVREAHRAGVPF